jgi:hypothetical protein
VNDGAATGIDTSIVLDTWRAAVPRLVVVRLAMTLW